MTLHILGHIKTQQLNTQRFGELNRDFGFTDPGRSGKQERAYWLVILTESGAAHLNGFG